jgi:hypothetical protein
LGEEGFLNILADAGGNDLGTFIGLKNL